VKEEAEELLLISVVKEDQLLKVVRKADSSSKDLQ